MSDQPKLLLSTSEAAELLGLTKTSLYQLTRPSAVFASGACGTLYTLQHLKDVLKIIGGLQRAQGRTPSRDDLLDQTLIR